MRIADRFGDLCPLWNRLYNWMFIEELQEKSTRKAERVLQFATNVAFCNGDSSGDPCLGSPLMKLLAGQPGHRRPQARG